MSPWHCCWCHCAACKNLCQALCSSQMNPPVLQPSWDITAAFPLSLSPGEGFEHTVTVDEEDSTIIIYDNWRQVSLKQCLREPYPSLLFSLTLPLPPFRVLYLSIPCVLGCLAIKPPLLFTWRCAVRHNATGRNLVCPYFNFFHKDVAKTSSWCVATMHCFELVDLLFTSESVSVLWVFIEPLKSINKILWQK